MATLRNLSAALPNLNIVLLTSAVDASRIVEALKFGVRGAVPKEADTTLLLKCIRKVMAGSYWISRDVTNELAKGFTSLSAAKGNQSKPINHRFSERERQVLESVLFGYSNKEIAKELCVSEQAVKYHLTNMFRKTGVSGRMQLARFTIDRQLLPQVQEGA
jgi:DNA-binding NarL/FixJ family response regulator